jgi:hypothetical protein
MACTQARVPPQQALAAAGPAPRQHDYFMAISKQDTATAGGMAAGSGRILKWASSILLT